MSNENLLFNIPNSKFEELQSRLCDNSGKTPLHERFRALFTLRNFSGQENKRRAIDIISFSLMDEKNDSALLKHELAYCLGQMKDGYACGSLEKSLRNLKEDAMVRHEAAEALGAIGEVESLKILEEYRYRTGELKVVSQTCELAIAKIKYENEMKENEMETNDDEERIIYNSIDPAPAIKSMKNVKELGKNLLDTSLPLFERYRTMFRLRDIGTSEAIEVLSEGLRASRRPEAKEEVEKSALFRHEIAYVFGQMGDKRSIPALIESLKDEEEADMVRHESAEALGSIATPDVLPVLKEYITKGVPRVVLESCVVALDMYEYENSEKLEYADGLIE